MACTRFIFMMLLCCPIIGWAALPTGVSDFPNLTGRVVDNADMLSASLELQMKQRLEAHEKDTGNQIVIVTLRDLQGHSVESFGYTLARHWGIGQNDRSNGVVLLVAKAERKIRIEVGYGLEGALTDALAGNIIRSVIMPNFKLGKFDEGIAKGVDAIIAAIAGEYQAQPAKNNSNDYAPFIIFAFIFLLIVVKSANSGSGHRYDDRRYYGSGRRGHGGVRSGRSGGFSGGGGSFGGGGASGGW